MATPSTALNGAAAPLPGMVGSHPSMQEVYRLARLAAGVDLPTLVVGETGTGKELVARAVHVLGPAAAGPFMDVNCAAIPEHLAEAEFFGWERGAFTGAERRTLGLLELAHEGALFLDEACSLPTGIQAKLLRALEQREFRRVGGRTPVHASFRLVAALSEDPELLVRAGRMRADFAYRLAGITIVIPPLRSRRSDIVPLAEHFLRQVRWNGDGPKRIHPDAVSFLLSQAWPGNVRELRAAVERLALLTDGPVIALADVASQFRAPASVLEDRTALEAVLGAHEWDISRSARALHIGRTRLYDLLRRHRLTRPPATR